MVQSQPRCVWAGSCACHKGLACHGCSRFVFVVRVWQYPLRAIYLDEELADSLKWNLKMQTVTFETIHWVLFCPSNSGKWYLIWRLITKKSPTQQWKTSWLGSLASWLGTGYIDPQFLPNKKRSRGRKPSIPMEIQWIGTKVFQPPISDFPRGECYEKLAEPGLLEELQKPRVPEGHTARKWRGWRGGISWPSTGGGSPTKIHFTLRNWWLIGRCWLFCFFWVGCWGIMSIFWFFQADEHFCWSF